ncbi:hypothetical protein Sjap_015698 [Stephania japonica]|uniref:Uncharacterized protein n=1 Tax=Stephania japonica TaxID=461633 RepID=A0AAP0IJL2_9MAGN
MWGKKIPTLLELCIQTAIDNVRYLGDVGETDIDLLKEILPHCTVDHLMHIENSTEGRDLSPITDNLWKRFYEQQFGVESCNLVIERMKRRKAKQRDVDEAQKRAVDRFKQRFGKEVVSKKTKSADSALHEGSTKQQTELLWRFWIMQLFFQLERQPDEEGQNGISQQNFNPIPFFEDTKLTKTFLFSDEGTTKITGTTIKWKEGKDLANGVNHDKKGSKRPFSDESFLRWFSETWKKDLAEGFHDEQEVDEENMDGDEDDEVGKEVDGIGEDEDDDEDDEEDDDEGGDEEG